MFFTSSPEFLLPCPSDVLRNPLRSDEERGPDRLGERRSFGRLAHAGRDSLIQLPCRSGTVGKTPPESEVAESWSRHIHAIESHRVMIRIPFLDAFRF